jgi:putative acetyltransferase
MDGDIVIRPETPADFGAVRDVTQRAFAGRPYSGGNEQDIIDALRAQNALAVSLVAERGGKIVGHVAFSPATAEDGSLGWYTLGPVSVEPSLQHQGIGKELINAGIGRLRDLQASGCILVGNTSYYSRFGFVTAPSLSPVAALKEHFMVLCLGSAPPNGVINFHPAFVEDGH